MVEAGGKDALDHLADQRRRERVNVAARGLHPPVFVPGRRQHLDREMLGRPPRFVQGGRGRRLVADIAKRVGAEIGVQRRGREVPGDQHHLGKRDLQHRLRADGGGELPAPFAGRQVDRDQCAALDHHAAGRVARARQARPARRLPAVQADHHVDAVHAVPAIGRNGGEQVREPAVEPHRGDHDHPGLDRGRVEILERGGRARLLGGHVEIMDPRPDRRPGDGVGRVKERPGAVDDRKRPLERAIKRRRVVHRRHPPGHVAALEIGGGQRRLIAGDRDRVKPAPQQLPDDEAPRVARRAIDRDVAGTALPRIPLRVLPIFLRHPVLRHAAVSLLVRSSRTGRPAVPSESRPPKAGQAAQASRNSCNGALIHR